MPVNLEELAIKSIEQYASLNVRLTSMEHTLADINRKNEAREDKLATKLDKISEDFANQVKINIQALKEELTKDISLARNDFDFDLNDLRKDLEDLGAKFKTHRNTHCIECKNDTRITSVAEDVTAISNDVKVIKDTDRSLEEVRKLATSPWGITFLRFITGKAGQIFIAAIFIDIFIDVIMHYEIIKLFWNLIMFK